MKLYLSSYRIPSPDELFKLLDKEPSEIKVAIIPNAKDYYAERARNIKLREAKDYLATLDLYPAIVDLRDYREAGQLKTKLAQYDLLWAIGGNTFCLRDEMKESGFDKIIHELLEHGLVYAGESAGAVAVGTSLKGTEFEDNPEFTEKIVWDGIGIVPNIILPHSDNVMFAEAIDKARQMHKDDPTLIEITDSQALVINGTDSKIVG